METEKHLRTTILEALRKIMEQVLLVVIALLVATIILSFTGYSPAVAFYGIWRGIVDLGGMLRWTIPLIFCGLAIAVAFRTGVFNLGVDGQLYLGAVAATWVGLQVSKLGLPGSILILAAILGGCIAGGLWACIAGILRVVWGANEVVATLMLNFVAVFLTDFLVLGPMRGTGATGTTYSSDTIPKSMWLHTMIRGSRASTGIFIAIVLALILAFILFRTTLGYEFKVVGSSPLFARYGGIHYKRVLLISIVMSGLIAGLAGTIEVLGVHHRFPGRFNPGLGFDGIVVSLIARHNPIGILASGLFFGALQNGARNMERIMDVPKSMVEIVQGMIILVVSTQFLFIKFKQRKGQKSLRKYFSLKGFLKRDQKE